MGQPQASGAPKAPGLRVALSTGKSFYLENAFFVALLMFRYQKAFESFKSQQKKE